MDMVIYLYNPANSAIFYYSNHAFYSIKPELSKHFLSIDLKNLIKSLNEKY